MYQPYLLFSIICQTLNDFQLAIMQLSTLKYILNVNPHCYMYTCTSVTGIQLLREFGSISDIFKCFVRFLTRNVEFLFNLTGKLRI